MRSLNCFILLLVVSMYVDVVINLKILMSSSYGGRSHIKSFMEITNNFPDDYQIYYMSMEDNLKFSKPYQRIQTKSLGFKGYLDDEIKSRQERLFLNYRGDELNEIYFKLLESILVESYTKEFLPIRSTIMEIQPDLMICDFLAVACRDLAQHFKIPLIIGVQAIDGLEPTLNSIITNNINYGPITTLNLSIYSRFKFKLLAALDNLILFKPTLDRINLERIKFNLSPTDFINFQYGLVLANSYFGFEASRPIPPNFKLIGPILTPSHPKLVDDQFRKFMDDHNKLLYIGFGSHVVLNNQEIHSILETSILAIHHHIIDGIIWGLGNTPYHRLPHHLTINGKKFPIHHHPHLLITPWSPQSTILSHPHIQLFLSHCGLESSFEAISTATPILCYPIFGDQPRNSRKLEDMKIATHITPDTLTQPSSLLHQINLTLHSATLPDQLHYQSTILHLNSVHSHHQTSHLIRNYLQLAQSCRPILPYHPNNSPPCELSPLLPITHQLPFLTSTNLDLYLLTITLTLLSLTMALWCIGNIVKRLMNYFISVYRLDNPSKLKLH